MQFFGNTKTIVEKKKQMDQGVYRGVTYKTSTTKKVIDNRTRIYRGQMQ